uniref:Cytochrome n=2 Tax=Macrostomum lignano TaxID=282301 RepID=A0A1I8I239_9PLAT
GSDALLQARAGTYLSVSYSRNLSGVRSGRASMDSLLLLLPAQRQRHLVAAAALAAASAAAYLLLRRRQRPRPPPGPRPWPLFGNLFNLERPTFLVAHSKWRRQYGDLVSFTFGSRRFVILNSYAVIKEALTSPEWAEVFSGRINSPFILSMTHGKGIVSAEGELWREHRRFALKVLRDFGFARSGTEEAIHAELAELQQTLDAEPAELVPRAIANVISVLLFNYRAGTQDEGFTDFMLASQENLQGNNIGRFIPTAFPGLYSIPGFMRLLQLIGVDVFVFKRNIEVTHRFCRDQIDRHRRNLAEVSEPADFLDAFLLEQQRLNSKRSDHSFDDFQLVRTLTELFIAGTDTTSNTIRWALLYAALHPECQDRIAAEVEAATGNSRLPVYRDKKAMHFTMAFIDEVQRYSTLAPFSVGHRCTRDIRFKGYDISSNDLIMVNLYGVHHDPELWDQPEQFRPERFINSSGEYETSEFLVPFSIGKRACLGESLARQELFLFLSGIFQAYRVELHKDCYKDLKDIEVGSAGLVHAPGKHQIIFHRRAAK